MYLFSCPQKMIHIFIALFTVCQIKFFESLKNTVFIKHWNSTHMLSQQNTKYSSDHVIVIYTLCYFRDV